MRVIISIISLNISLAGIHILNASNPEFTYQGTADYTYIDLNPGSWDENRLNSDAGGRIVVTNRSHNAKDAWRYSVGYIRIGLDNILNNNNQKLDFSEAITSIQLEINSVDVRSNEHIKVYVLPYNENLWDDDSSIADIADSGDVTGSNSEINLQYYTGYSNNNFTKENPFYDGNSNSLNNITNFGWLLGNAISLGHLSETNNNDKSSLTYADSVDLSNYVETDNNNEYLTLFFTTSNLYSAHMTTKLYTDSNNMTLTFNGSAVPELNSTCLLLILAVGNFLILRRRKYTRLTVKPLQAFCFSPIHCSKQI